MERTAPGRRSAEEACAWCGLCRVLGGFLLVTAASVLLVLLSQGKADAEPQPRTLSGAAAAQEPDELDAGATKPSPTRSGQADRTSRRLDRPTADPRDPDTATPDASVDTGDDQSEGPDVDGTGLGEVDDAVGEVDDVTEPVVDLADPVVDDAKGLLPRADLGPARGDPRGSPEVRRLPVDQRSESAVDPPAAGRTVPNSVAPPAIVPPRAHDGMPGDAAALAVVLPLLDEDSLQRGERAPDWPAPIPARDGAPTHLRPGAGTATPDDDAVLDNHRSRPTFIAYSCERKDTRCRSERVQLAARPG